VQLLVAAARAWRGGGQGRPVGRCRRAGFVSAPEPEDGRRDEVGVPGFVGAPGLVGAPELVGSPEPEAGRRDDVGVPGFVSSGRGGWPVALDEEAGHPVVVASDKEAGWQGMIAPARGGRSGRAGCEAGGGCT